MSATLTQAIPVLDLRIIPPPQRHPRVFGCFDDLPMGQSLQLVNDHNPQPLRYQFEDRVFGQFDWVVLEAGPAVWRVQIDRIAPAAAKQAGARGDACCSGGACCG